MANNFFFTGEKGIGKSTLIDLYVMKHFSGKFGGFRTLKNVHEGNRISFHMANVNLLERLTDDNLLFYCHDDSMNDGIDINERFNTLSSFLDDYDKYDLIIMDEIGPHEEEAEDFKNRIRKILDSDKYVIGVIQKSESKFLDEISKMKEKNLVVEILRKLIAEQVRLYKRTNVVKSEKFSEIIQIIMNKYINGLITNAEVIEELLKLAKQIVKAHKEGDNLGLSSEELAFYDALTKPKAVKDFYENDVLIAMTKELTETLRKNKTIDWQKKTFARAKMQMMIKKLLKKYKYPPEGQEDAIKTVMQQCELWTDNVDMHEPTDNYNKDIPMAAENMEQYN